MISIILDLNLIRMGGLNHLEFYMGNCMSAKKPKKAAQNLLLREELADPVRPKKIVPKPIRREVSPYPRRSQAVNSSTVNILAELQVVDMLEDSQPSQPHKICHKPASPVRHHYQNPSHHNYSSGSGMFSGSSHHSHSSHYSHSAPGASSHHGASFGGGGHHH